MEGPKSDQDGRRFINHFAKATTNKTGAESSQRKLQMNKIIGFLIMLGMTISVVVPAEAWVGPRRPGVGVGRPGAYGVGGLGRVGRPAARPYVRATPYRPYVGPVVR